jgi:hypothetical protein
MRFEVPLDKVGAGKDVVVEEDNQPAAGLSHAPVTRPARALIRLPEHSQVWVACLLLAFQHLSGSVIGPIKDDDHLEAVRRVALPPERRNDPGE